MYGTEDNDTPMESAHLEGAENIELEGVSHDGPQGLQQHPDAYREVKRVLEYPYW